MISCAVTPGACAIAGPCAGVIASNIIPASNSESDRSADQDHAQAHELVSLRQLGALSSARPWHPTRKRAQGRRLYCHNLPLRVSSVAGAPIHGGRVIGSFGVDAGVPRVCRASRTALFISMQVSHSM